LPRFLSMSFLPSFFLSYGFGEWAIDDSGCLLLQT
jgi:hypothetical protein